MIDALQWAILSIAVFAGVWYAGKAFCSGFKEGYQESRAERAAKREAENDAARKRHPSSGTMPWAPDDARDLTD